MSDLTQQFEEVVEMLDALREAMPQELQYMKVE